MVTKHWSSGLSNRYQPWKPAPISLFYILLSFSVGHSFFTLYPLNCLLKNYLKGGSIITWRTKSKKRPCLFLEQASRHTEAQQLKTDSYVISKELKTLVETFPSTNRFAVLDSQSLSTVLMDSAQSLPLDELEESSLQHLWKLTLGVCFKCILFTAKTVISFLWEASDSKREAWLLWKADWHPGRESL